MFGSAAGKEGIFKYTALEDLLLALVIKFDLELHGFCFHIHLSIFNNISSSLQLLTSIYMVAQTSANVICRHHRHQHGLIWTNQSIKRFLGHLDLNFSAKRENPRSITLPKVTWGPFGSVQRCLLLSAYIHPETESDRILKGWGISGYRWDTFRLPNEFMLSKKLPQDRVHLAKRPSLGRYIRFHARDCTTYVIRLASHQMRLLEALGITSRRQNSDFE